MLASIIKFFENSRSAIEKQYTVLFALKNKFGDTTEESLDSLWYCVDRLEFEVKLAKDRPDLFDTTSLNILFLADMDLIVELVKCLDDLDALLLKSSENPVVPVSLTAMENFRKLHFSEVLLERWQSAFSGLEQEKQIQARNLLQQAVGLAGDLHAQLMIIITLIENPNLILPFTLEKFDKATVEDLLGKNNITFLLTLLDAKNNEKIAFRMETFGMNFCMNYKQEYKNSEINNFSWKDALLIYLVLDFLYYRLSKLARWDIEFLLKNYFYKAITMGISVQQILRDLFFSLNSPISFVEYNKDLISIINENTETIIIDLENKKEEPLMSVLHKHSERMNKESVGGFATESFVNNIYGNQKGRQAHVLWLQETIYIYEQLLNFKLFDWDNDKEKFPHESYELDMLRLLFYFGFLDILLVRIADYFIQEGHRVKLKQFVKRLAETADLSDERMVEKASRLTSLLQERGLMTEDRFLVVFDEKNNKFEWNMDLLDDLIKQ